MSDVSSTDAELTVEGLLRMLLRVVSEMSFVFEIVERNVAVESHVAERCSPCEVWLNAYEAAPEAVRESLARSGMTNAFAAALANTALGLNVATPLDAFVRVTKDDRLSSDTITRLFRVLQRCGLFAAADRRDLALELTSSANGLSPRAFALLLTDPNVDAAFPGPTRCCAGDAHTPPRHHSVRSTDDRGVIHVVLYAAARNNAEWSAFSDARLPFGARAMDEEWAYALRGPCGCPGRQRIDCLNALHSAIERDNDEAGEWLATRLPTKRLNQRDGFESIPLIAALRRDDPMPRTVAALLSRVPDVDLTRRVKWRWRQSSIRAMTFFESGDGKAHTAAEWITRYPAPKWLPSHLAAELKLKTEQFGAQYLPSAAVLCVEALCGAANVPRELVNLILQYTQLPRPHPWPNAPAARACADVTPTA